MSTPMRLLQSNPSSPFPVSTFRRTLDTVPRPSTTTRGESRGGRACYSEHKSRKKAKMKKQLYTRSSKNPPKNSVIKKMDTLFSFCKTKVRKSSFPIFCSRNLFSFNSHGLDACIWGETLPNKGLALEKAGKAYLFRELFLE